MTYSFAAISDIHIKGRSDSNYRLIIKFLNSAQVQSADYIFFLGDLFDLMCGSHNQYYQEFGEFFDLVYLKLKQGKIIYYFEGNHDLHLKKLFSSIWKTEYIGKGKWHVLKRPMLKKMGKSMFYFSHGDELNQDDKNYLIYRHIIQNKIAEGLANFAVPYKVLEFLGSRASQISRRYSQMSDLEGLKKKVREQVMKLSVNADYYICGHTHVSDHFLFDESKQYLNCGHVGQTKKFIWWNERDIEFIDLE